MSEQSIALNRFGLGARGDDAPPENPRRWLLGQFDRYDPNPAALRDRPGSKAAAADFLHYRLNLRGALRGTDQVDSLEEAGEDLQQVLRGYFGKVRDKYFADVAARGQVAIDSDTPFVERMVHFWSNHFAVSVAKRQVSGLVAPYEFEAIRPHVLGSFRELLRAAALHPGMLLYLDQDRSVGPNSLGARFRASRGMDEVGLNENLAREILELHTLGVDGGYTQADVTEFARALTGYTFDGLPYLRDAQPLGNGAAFSLVVHEPGRRTILGKTYRQRDGDQALAVLDDLARHPSTARFVATKLARHFSADDPPGTLVARLETAFRNSDGDLPTLYRTLIEAPETWRPERHKFRTPWEWSVGALRATGVRELPARIFTGIQSELGQTTWGPPSPAGFADTAASWAAPDALLRRIEVAERIATASRRTDVPALARRLFPDALNDTTATAIARAESPNQGLALLLAAPEMMRR